MMRLFERAADVHHREEREYEGLQEHDHHAQHRRKGKQRIRERHEHEEHDMDLLVSEYVSEKPEREGDRPGYMAYYLDRYHERHEPPDRAAKLLQVPQSVFLDAHYVGEDEYYQRERQRGVEVGGRRKESGNEAHQVRYEDEYRKRHDEREVLLALVAHGLVDHALEVGQREFYDRLGPAGHELQALCQQYREYRQADAYVNHEGRMYGQPECRDYGVMHFCAPPLPNRPWC